MAGEYLRPHIESVEFRDEHGNIIDYGNRWANLQGVPPDNSYSVDENTERFAPLHTVATALIEHLVSHYEVDVEEGHHLTTNLSHPPAAERTVRVVQLAPRSEACAPLVFILTSYPGLEIHAGTLFREHYPSCGCNACDESWDYLADELEWKVFAIVGGGFHEEMSEPRRAKWSYARGHGFVKGMGQTITHRMQALDGNYQEKSQLRAKEVPGELLKSALARLDALTAVNADGNWLPWPRRR